MNGLEFSGTLDFGNVSHFSEVEFNSIGCSKSDIYPASLARLELLRTLVGKPLRLTSAYRSPATEIAAGRSGRSAHTLGRAFDIACTSDSLRYLIVSAALSVGFNRIGIGRTFVHVDDETTSHNDCRIWTYYK